MVRGFVVVVVGALAVAPPPLVRSPEELAIFVVSSGRRRGSDPTHDDDDLPAVHAKAVRWLEMYRDGSICMGKHTHTALQQRETQKMRRAIYNQMR